MVLLSDSALVGGNGFLAPDSHSLMTIFLSVVQSYLLSLQTLSAGGLLFLAWTGTNRPTRPPSLVQYIVAHYQMAFGKDISYDTVKTQLKKLRKEARMPGESFPFQPARASGLTVLADTTATMEALVFKVQQKPPRHIYHMAVVLEKSPRGVEIQSIIPSSSAMSAGWHGQTIRLNSTLGLKTTSTVTISRCQTIETPTFNTRWTSGRGRLSASQTKTVVIRRRCKDKSVRCYAYEWDLSDCFINNQGEY